ncbi:MAG: S26 family signal peptidase [Pseudomonadota bacterium]
MKRAIILGLAAVSSGLMALPSVLSSHEVLLWNRTVSAPKGLYWRSDGPLTLNGWAVVSGKAPAAIWIADHGFLAPGWPVIKRVRGLPGDEICRVNETVSINGETVATALETDSSGLELPSWSGCFTLGEGEVFFLNDHRRSLDGRYFGATKIEDVRGSARLLFSISD